MKKSSMIFKMLCLALAVALCFSVITVFADDAAETNEDVTSEVVESAAEDVEDETILEEEEVLPEEDVTAPEEDVTAPEEEVEAPVEDETAEEPEEEVEVLDLYAAALRDGGVYITPSEYNAAVFDYNGVRYRVAPGEGNAIKLDGFESNFPIKSEISETAKNSLQANGEITTDAAHSGYFGLSVSHGDVIYRTGVTGDKIYVFSAWVKMPQSSGISNSDRAFKVTSESGDESYIVGWNEIGRDIKVNGSWQQILFTFKAPETGVFAIDFEYTGRSELYIDDVELYVAEVFDNPIDIKSVVCTDANGAEFTKETGFTTSGTLTHTTTLYNNDEDDVFFTAVMVLYKNDIMIDFEAKNECALVLDDTEVVFEIEIPEDEDLSQYKYMVFFINDIVPTQYYGEMPSRTNPFVVKGK